MKQNPSKKTNYTEDVKTAKLEIVLHGEPVSLYDIKKIGEYIVGKDISTDEEIFLKNVTEEDLHDFEKFVQENQASKGTPNYETIKKMDKFIEKGLLPPLGKNDVEEILFDVDEEQYFKSTSFAEKCYMLKANRVKKGIVTEYSLYTHKDLF